MKISSGEGNSISPGLEVSWCYPLEADRDGGCRENCSPDKVFPERALGLCSEWGPVLPAGVGHSSWELQSWAEAMAGSPCRGGDLSPDSGSPAKAWAGTGAGGGGSSRWGGGISVPVAEGPAGTEVWYAQCAGQYPAGLVSFGREVSGLDLPSVDPWVLHL